RPGRGAGDERPGARAARGAPGRPAPPRRAERGGRHAPGDGRTGAPGRGGPPRGEGRAMTRLLGLIRVLGIVLMVVVVYAVLLAMDPNARSWNNQQTIATRLGFYGILTVGVGVLIVSGGIDLSIGSVIGLVAVLFGLMLESQVPPWQAALAVLGL